MKRFIYLDDLANTSVLQVLEALHAIHKSGLAGSGFSKFTSRLLAEYRKRASPIGDVDPKKINTKSKLFNGFRMATDLESIIKCVRSVRNIVDSDFPFGQLVKKEKKKDESKGEHYEEAGNILEHFENILRSIFDSMEMTDEMKMELDNLQSAEHWTFAARLSRCFADALLCLGPTALSETILNLYCLYQVPSPKAMTNGS